MAQGKLLPQEEQASGGTKGRIFYLDLSTGQVLSANPDGSGRTILVDGGQRLPDGLVVDVANGHLYWTNMGNPKANDGMLMRANLDGSNLKTIVPAGGTYTPKQLQLDKASGKLYWCDREGMRVMRCNLDGSEIETIVDTSHGDSHPGSDPTKWCVGIALDNIGGKVYWSQKGGDNTGLGRIFCANFEIPAGETAATRTDIELLYQDLPEPIDLDLDLANRYIYWTDRGDAPRGNTVNRAPMDAQPGKADAVEIIFDHLMEGIGLSLDLKGGRMYFTDLAGSVYSARLDGTDRKNILVAQGNLSGIAYAEL